MKRCPECGRNYNDDSMSFCLDDGAELLFGPASGDDPQTAILHDRGGHSEAATRAQIYTTGKTEMLPANERPGASRSYDKRLLVVPVLLAVTLLGGFLGYRYVSQGGQIESIAVMPFVNESGNPDVEYLSDGMTETLINSLSQLANLSVKGRSSVFRYKGKDIDTKTLGKELAVQAVLYGRVIQRGDQLTLNLELLDAATENVIWSGKYDRKQSDVVTLQSEIARDVSNKLKSRLSGADVAKVEKGYTSNPEAYKLYLQGRFHWNKRTEDDLKKSLDYFNQAIERDPAYALAYAGLADAYGILPVYAADPSPDDYYPKARAAAQKAFEIDPSLAEPHATLAYVLHQYDWKHAEAEKEFKRAIELDPNYPSAHQWYGEFLANMGRFDDAIAEGRRAVELDPLSPILYVSLGSSYKAAHRYDETMATYRKAVEIDPKFVRGYAGLANTCSLQGMYEESIEVSRTIRLVRGIPAESVEKEVTEIRDAYRKSGPAGYWQWILDFNLKNAQENKRQPNALAIARAQLGMGKKDEALSTMEKAMASGDRASLWFTLKAEPVWDPLRDDPRFKELVRKVGLPE